MWWLMALLSGCWLEYVDSANPEELDPAFYEAGEKLHGLPGEGGGSAIPFSNYDGPKVTVYGTVTGSENMAVDVDVRVPEDSAPGGMLGLGKVLMDGPGTFELQVPVDQGFVELQAFQDPDKDGPSTSDPFAQAQIEVGSSDMEVTMELVAGGWSMGGPVHQDMPAGAGEGGVGSQMVPPDPDQPDPFASYGGSRVSVGGLLQYHSTATVDLDIFRSNRAASGGREMIGKLKLSTGSYELRVPEHFGPIILEAFIDLDGNMRADPTDPMGAYSGNPLRVGDNDVWNVDINISIQENGKMPSRAAPAGAGGGGMGL
jgi:hypothetical protein